MASPTAAPATIRPSGLPRHRPAALRRGARHPRHRARVRARPRAAARGRLVRGGAHPRASSRPRSASWGCSACTWRATAARARARPPTGSRCLELEAGDSGLRSLVSVQGSLAMFAIWRWGSEEQKQRVAAADGRRRSDRLLRADRARCRLGSRLDAHARAARRQRLDPARAEDVDHQRLDRRCRGRVGAHRRGRPRLPRAPRHQRLHHPGHPPQALAARVGHLRAAARRRAPARRRACCPRPPRCAARCRA